MKDLLILILQRIWVDTNSVKEITLEINKIKEEIKKAEDSCLSLDNWICEV